MPAHSLVLQIPHFLGKKLGRGEDRAFKSLAGGYSEDQVTGCYREPLTPSRCVPDSSLGLPCSYGIQYLLHFKGGKIEASKVNLCRAKKQINCMSGIKILNLSGTLFPDPSCHLSCF
jgi:hypothetical protein